jgi:Mce-associated membrane protein
MAGPAVDTDRQVTAESTSPNPLAVEARRPTSWVIALLVVAVLVLGVIGLLQAFSLPEVGTAQARESSLSQERDAAVSAASNEIVGLLTVSGKTAKADIQRLLDGAAAQFHDQLQQEATSFQKALAQGKVTSKGAIASAGLVSLRTTGKTGTAVVAIAAKATVKNSAAPKGDARNYRLTVTVEKTGGKWLVSAITFVV